MCFGKSLFWVETGAEKDRWRADTLPKVFFCRWDADFCRWERKSVICKIKCAVCRRESTFAPDIDIASINFLI